MVKGIPNNLKKNIKRENDYDIPLKKVSTQKSNNITTKDRDFTMIAKIPVLKIKKS